MIQPKKKTRKTKYMVTMEVGDENTIKSARSDGGSHELNIQTDEHGAGGGCYSKIKLPKPGAG